MDHVFHRQLTSSLPMAAYGDGPYIVDTRGKRYLDASGGAAVSCLGHSDADVVAAIKYQLDRQPFAHTGFFTSEPAEELADFLNRAAPGDLDRVYFVSGGSEAVECALKMARQYHVERGEPDRHRFIARRQSYHGNTLGALSVGHNAGRRALFEPILLNDVVHHVSPCYAYRHQLEGETPERYGQRLALELESTIRRLGPETICAFVAETVVGATAGVLPPVPGYLKGVRHICDAHGILLILDEVMSGMGRTGHLFACAEDDVIPDMVCIAKGLGAGYQPIGAVVVREPVFRAFRQGSGAFQHGHTYMGHPTATAAALAVQRKIQSENLLDNVLDKGAKIRAGLAERLGENPHLGDIRGRGLFIGVELVADRDSKEPFEPAQKLHARIKSQAMERGLMVYPAGGTADGIKGDHVLIAPPFIWEDEQVEEFLDKFTASLGAAFDSLSS
ncbi:MAG: aspartate aminotransferase family protein [Rhodospirillales bacterium]